MPEISVDIESTRPVIAANLEELRYLVFHGMTGDTGQSAYELAVELGFEGTEAQWLASLKGADGKDGADGKNYGIVVDGSTDNVLELKSVEADTNGISYVTPGMFGAKGDGVTDDTEAVQAAFFNEQHLPIVLTGKYFVTDEIVVGGWNNYVIHGAGSEIIYSGTGSAIVIQTVRYGDFHFGAITAANGTCIEFRADNWQTYSAYIRLTFDVLTAKDYCIFANVSSNSCSNQVEVHGGRFAGGSVGAYIKNDTINAKYNVNEWHFDYVGIEGVSTGFKLESLTNSINGITIWYPRFKEDTLSTTLVQAIGVLSFSYLYLDAPVNASHFDFDNSDNQMEVYAPFTENGAVVSRQIRVKSGSIIKYQPLTDYEKNKMLSGLLTPKEFDSATLTQTNNPLTLAEEMTAEGNYTRIKLAYTYDNTGKETVAPVGYGTYLIIQRMNRAQVFTAISARIYLNTYDGSGWSGWKSVTLS